MSADPSRPEPALGLLGSRAMAFILDLVLVMVLMVVAMQVEITLGMQFPVWIFHAVAALYLGLLPATPLQATLGKRMVGLRISDGAGKRIGVLRSLLRLGAWVPSIGIAGAGFVLAAFTPRRQALHDLVAGTLVVNKAATPSQIAVVAAPISTVDRIVLVLGCALLAFAVHAFLQFREDFREREGVYELLDATRPFKAEVAKALRSGASMPAPTVLPRQARAMLARPDGTIVIEVSDEIAPGGRVTLRPEALPKGEYLWACRAEGVRHLPAACRP